ncbi:hypothetical protein OQA88_9976 [Cercophora sp. LCS_1]
MADSRHEPRSYDPAFSRVAHPFPRHSPGSYGSRPGSYESRPGSYDSRLYDAELAEPRAVADDEWTTEAYRASQAYQQTARRRRPSEEQSGPRPIPHRPSRGRRVRKESSPKNSPRSSPSPPAAIERAPLDALEEDKPQRVYRLSRRKSSPPGVFPRSPSPPPPSRATSPGSSPDPHPYQAAGQSASRTSRNRPGSSQSHRSPSPPLSPSSDDEDEVSSRAEHQRRKRRLQRAAVKKAEKSHVSTTPDDDNNNKHATSRSLPTESTRPRFTRSPSPRPTLAGESSTASVLGEGRYQHRPLGESCIRLIRILPERKTMIRCEILQVSLEDPPRYVAISYAWGDLGDTRKIDLEGSLVPISASLHGALSAIREKKEPVLVWADALSVDQQNLAERAQQVQLMTKIYASADSVAIWLGPEEDNSSDAVDLLNAITDPIISTRRAWKILSSEMGARGVPALVRLFEREYWHRLWVVQEILNARSITVYCGQTKSPWEAYRLTSNVISQFSADFERRFPEISTNMVTWHDTLVHQGPSSIPSLRALRGSEGELLHHVLRQCRERLASDPRDKLFGILGILPPEIRADFRADYTLSTKEVYTEIVDYIIKTTESLNIICDAHHPGYPTAAHSLPTFVPDWSNVAPSSSPLLNFGSFKAAGTTKARCRFLSERLHKLEMSAIFLDTVQTRGVAFGVRTSKWELTMAFLQWRAKVIEFVMDAKPERRRRMLQDFANTISVGRLPKEDGLAVCCHVFGQLAQQGMPCLQLDRELMGYLHADVDLTPHHTVEEFVDSYFGASMAGRAFFITERGLVGLGINTLMTKDIVVVPLGCSTPVILRPEGSLGEYRFVSEAYVESFMDGLAVDLWKQGDADLKKYVLH